MDILEKAPRRSSRACLFSPVCRALRKARPRRRTDCPKISHSRKSDDDSAAQQARHDRTGKQRCPDRALHVFRPGERGKRGKLSHKRGRDRLRGFRMGHGPDQFRLPFREASSLGQLRGAGVASPPHCHFQSRRRFRRAIDQLQLAGAQAPPEVVNETFPDQDKLPMTHRAHKDDIFLRAQLRQARSKISGRQVLDDIGAARRGKGKRVSFRKCFERRARNGVGEPGKIRHLREHMHAAGAVGMHPAQDRSADQPNGRAVARDEIEEVQLRGVEREDAGSLFGTEGKERPGTQHAAANQH